jgi:hypothetical protein
MRDPKEFADRVSKLFKDDSGKVGRIATEIFETIDGESAQDVMCAVAFIVSFIIDCSPDKRNNLDEFIQVAEKFINFDRPAFKSPPDGPQLQ